MDCGAILSLCLALSAAIHVDARSLKGQSPDDSHHGLTAIQVKEALSHQRVSPELQPESSKKFFKKDYPSDNRPGVDVLHFGHPYPVVQDNGEFDRDYVKDENSDNGHWKAQQEYDRLRHKLKKEKAEMDEALAKKTHEEGELKHAMRKYEDEAARNRAEAEAAAKAKADAKAKPKEEKKESQGWSWNWDWWPFSWPKWNWSQPESKPEKKTVAQGSGIGDATKDTEKAMDNLEDCKKQLAEAREQLKKVMEEVKEAKAKQAAEDAQAADAAQKHADAKKLTKSLTEKSSAEEAEYIAAKEEYLKQQAHVDQLEADLNAAAAKVKAYRDAEDRGGGVYNTKDPKSTAISIRSQALFLLAIAFVSHRF